MLYDFLYFAPWWENRISGVSWLYHGQKSLMSYFPYSLSSMIKVLNQAKVLKFWKNYVENDRKMMRNRHSLNFFLQGP